jgi:lysophospholipase L1-like esterase
MQRVLEATQPKKKDSQAMQNNQTQFGRWLRIGLTLLGLVIIAVALLVDVVMGGLSSGIGPLQLIAALCGLLLMIFPWLPLTLVGRSGLVLVSVLVMIVLLEFTLSLAGFKTEYHAPPNFDPNTVVELEIERGRVCDAERGCHWNVELMRNCPVDSVDRVCRVNEYGLSSEHEFTADSLPEDSYRILVLGDSFTWGASADYGQGWVDILERELQATTPVIVWNAAMPGTGTSQAILTARNLLPIMQPDLVILGFHSGNDFADNLYPYDRFINVFAADGSSIPVQQYSIGENGEPFRETDAVIQYRANGYTVSSVSGMGARVDELLRSTRLGTLLIGAYRVATWHSYHIPPTQALLEELQQLVAASGSELHVVIIPEEHDTLNPGQKYRAAVSVMDNVNIPYIDTLPVLAIADFQNENPDNKHLNNAGHVKVGQVVVDYVQQLIDD